MMAIERLKGSEAIISKSARVERRMERDNITYFRSRQSSAVVAYLQLRVDARGKATKVKDSADVAKMYFYSNAGTNSNRRRCIREWAKDYLRNGRFSTFQQGKHCKSYSIIHDEQVQQRMRNFINDIPALQRIPIIVKERLEQFLLPTIPRAPSTIHENTVSRWMHYLGFHPDVHSKNYYVDGHERENVVKHREQFLEKMLDFESRMIVYSGADMDVEEAPLLEEGQSRCVLITHDETTCNSNDAVKTVWVLEGKSDLRPKSRGQSLMVSGFMCECHGFIERSDGYRSYEIIKPGIHRDGWWTNDDLIKQLNHVMPMFACRRTSGLQTRLRLR